MHTLTAYVRSFAGFGRDARLFLLTTLVMGAATSIYWTDFNLYLEALGIDRSAIGFLMAISQAAAVVAVVPAIALANWIGRRDSMLAAGGLVVLAFGGFLFLGSGSILLLAGSVALYGAGSQMLQVVQIPYVAEKTSPEHRTEFFSAMFALSYGTNIISTIVGGTFATSIAAGLGLDSQVGPYRVLLTATLILALLAFLSIFLLASDRPADGRRLSDEGRFGFHVADRARFVKLLVPGFLTSLGAGQLIPYLNVFVKGKFGLDLASINVVFAITSLGTAAAILIQPALARRFGKIGSIVLVQACSIPFLGVLGFSPVFFTVVGAMAIRNSLMNAGSPIFDAFAMEHVTPAERAVVSGAMSLLWSLGWAIAGPYYGVLQGTLGFTAGYTVNFITCISLYILSTALLWSWFHDAEAQRRTAEVKAEAEAALAEAAQARDSSLQVA